jgi:oxalate decarboxylase
VRHEFGSVLSVTAPHIAGQDPGDVGYVEKTLPHYIENTGNEELRYLEVFRAPQFEDLSFSEWLSHTPGELVMAHLNINSATYKQIPTEKLVLIGRSS